MIAINIETGKKHRVEHNYIKDENNDSICAINSEHAGRYFTLLGNKEWVNIKHIVEKELMQKQMKSTPVYAIKNDGDVRVINNPINSEIVAAVNKRTGKLHAVQDGDVLRANGSPECAIGSDYTEKFFNLLNQHGFRKHAISKIDEIDEACYNLEESVEILSRKAGKDIGKLQDKFNKLEEQLDKNISATFKNLSEKQANIIESLENEVDSLQNEVRNMDNEYKRKFELLDIKIDEGKSGGAKPQTLTDVIKENVKGIIDLGYEVACILVTEEADRQLAAEQDQRTTEGYALMFNADIEIGESEPSWPHPQFKVFIK